MTKQTCHSYPLSNARAVSIERNSVAEQTKLLCSTTKKLHWKSVSKWVTAFRDFRSATSELNRKSCPPSAERWAEQLFIYAGCFTYHFEIHQRNFLICTVSHPGFMVETILKSGIVSAYCMWSGLWHRVLIEKYANTRYLHLHLKDCGHATGLI